MELTKEQKEKLPELIKSHKELQELYLESTLSIAKINNSEDIRYIKIDGVIEYDTESWNVEIRYFKEKSE